MSSRSGQGFVYRPEYKYKGVTKRSSIWWVGYSINGEKIRESSGSRSKKEAVRLLNQRLAERGRGVRRHDIEKTTYEDLEALILADYRKNGRKSLRRLQTSLGHLRDKYRRWRAVDITTAAWSAYQDTRLEEDEASAASINRERSALLRMIRLAVDHGLLVDIPRLDRLRENNVRDVDVSPAEFARLCDHLPEHVKPLAIFGYITGWRRDELLSRNWADVDEETGWLWLDRSTAKNRQPKGFPLGQVPWLDDTLAEQRVLKQEIERQSGRIVTALFLFHWGRRAGESIKTFRRSWDTACRKAGLLGLRFHDLRRSAAVQMLEAGGGAY
jgi:integrase